jgi:hypothetical protein
MHKLRHTDGNERNAGRALFEALRVFSDISVVGLTEIVMHQATWAHASARCIVLAMQLQASPRTRLAVNDICGDENGDGSRRRR